ncbi:MAG: hypothetical protein COZ06_31520 [Armatimonadetes bacterium CG_4_10_14_3_um_filter_66_18]|nr:hypothetical protein [Armatimonadota bacterium]PIX39967.1 MAG: hypothetical protein COZ57_27080 [Armatimonadetes bacterium CG_4_8_14_3_um_filter_66_20]PIY38227.1 MAG: hypothetical protein COZ06_31520 [Armatimonadetes bacterium CG_4_10_14_3_um_filter_66_18]NCO95849.1 hypothetical protein [Armatimonadota bacterium]NCQ30258.1 hypothetical protein [Armatimonadota bacterium]
MIPTVDFCGLNATRLIIGANPFGGYSHQNPQRDKEMVSYYTIERIKETWQRAEAAGINTMITNNETPHVLQATQEYLAEGGKLQWIAQVNCRLTTMLDAVDEVVESGCKALFFHGGQVDARYSEQDEKTLRAWVDHAHSHGIPVGVAGHAPKVHLWVDSLDLVDFHAVCFFNCGSLHDGAGDKFSLRDVAPAAQCTRQLAKPCIGYKIMGSGRLDALMAFEYAFENLKPTDVVNVGMHRGDKDNMVEENVALVQRVLGC